MQCLKTFQKLLRMVQARMKSPQAIIFHMGKVLLLFCVKRTLTSHFEVNIFSHKEYCLILLPLCLGICFKFGSFNRRKNNKPIEL